MLRKGLRMQRPAGKAGWLVQGVGGTCRAGDGGAGQWYPSLGAGSCWLVSAVIPYSLMPLASVQSSPWLGLSMPHTLVPIAIPETARIDPWTTDQLGLVRGVQSWREAMCCAATERVQMSKVFHCEKLHTVQHKSLAFAMSFLYLYLCALCCTGTCPRGKAARFHHSSPWALHLSPWLT